MVARVAAVLLVVVVLVVHHHHLREVGRRIPDDLWLFSSFCHLLLVPYVLAHPFLHRNSLLLEVTLSSPFWLIHCSNFSHDLIPPPNPLCFFILDP